MDPTQEATTQEMHTPPESDDMGMEVLQEITDDTERSGQYIGQCKWFNNSYGYGFITIWDGPQKGKDIFVHHSGIKPMNSIYKTLKKGEYIEFDIITGGDKGQQATNVRGIKGGPLLCDHVQVKKVVVGSMMVDGGAFPSLPPSSSMFVPNPQNQWNTVTYRKPRLPPLYNKRKRFGTEQSSPPTEQMQEQFSPMS